MPKLVVHKRAARYLERMDARIKAQLLTKLRGPGERSRYDAGRETDGGRMGGVPPVSTWGLAGDLSPRPANGTIVVTHVGPRGDVYK
jgi:mRNA-degrading endonuclease RelE of RelBE toxin-antitoxin system